MANETMEWFLERVNNPKHFTARHIDHISRTTGMDRDLVAKIIGGIIIGVVAVCEQGYILCNLLLTVVPFMLIFVYPDEKPTDSSLFVYFITFGMLTVFDRTLEKIAFYYAFKLVLLMFLFVPPYVLHEKIHKFIVDQVRRNTRRSHSTRSRINRDSTVTAVSSTPMPTAATQSMDEGRTTPPSTNNEVDQNNNNKAQPTTSGSDLAEGSKRFKDGENPMASSSAFQLKSDSEGFCTKSVLPSNNLNDMFFFPTERIVFNAPFDFDNLTYHIKILNNSHHRIAYAIKGNAVPRVMAYPPFGILNVKETRLIAVTVQKFVWNPDDYEKDRIAIDYVILPDSNKDKEFNFKMLQHSETKRRKNLKIVYNL